MTTRQETFNLDRLITAHVVTTGAGAKSYGFDIEASAPTPRDGQWLPLDSMAPTVLVVGIKDSDGLDLPAPAELSLPLTPVLVSWDLAAPTELTATAYETVMNIFGQSEAIRLTFDAPVPEPGTAQKLTLTLPLSADVEHLQSRRVWAARRDYRPKDMAMLTPNAEYVLGDVVFIVRDVVYQRWEVGTIMLDDRGETRTVVGMAHDVGGRGRHVELLARLIT